MLLAGILLFITPDAISPLWFWALTPLMACAVSAWVLGIGIILGHAFWENDWKRIRGGALAYGVYNLMQIIALFHFPDQIIFGVSFWIYIAVIVGGLILGWYGWMVAQKIK